MGVLRFTKDHEWVSFSGDEATVGITAHAVQELGDIVFVDLPSLSDEFEQASEFGSVESVKTVSSLYMPITGIVTAVNAKVTQNPELINTSPMDDGWLIRVSVSDEKELDDLMTEPEYEEYLTNLH